MAESGDNNAVEIEPTVTIEAEIPVTETEAETEAAPQDQEAITKQPEKPAGGGYKKKLNKAEAEIASLREKLAKFESTSAPEKPLDKPKPEDYQTFQEYEDAKDRYMLETATSKAVETLEKKTSETKSKEDLKAKVQAYEDKMDKAREIYPDYDEVTESYDGPMTVQMQTAMLDSDVGAEIAYYLAKNPDEAEAMAGMTIMGMAKAMGKLEARLESEKSGKAAVKTTKAPPPITPVRASSKVQDPHERGYIEVA